MGPLWATIKSCLRHDYTILIVQRLVIFIPTIAVYQACLWGISEGVEYAFVFSMVVSQTPALQYTCSAHR